MIRLGSIAFCLLVALSAKSQDYVDSLGVVTKDTMYVIEEVYISNEKLSPEELEARKQFLMLKSRVYRTYPYAKTASERLEVLNQNLAKLKTKREKKRYLKITEEYMENEFEARLKKLSRKDGQILVKLIHRQTGQTTYELVKDLKSGWSAYWYGKTARLFSIDLKTTYQPYTIQEDFWIEDILLEAFENRRLIEQPPKNRIDYLRLANIWREKEREKKETIIKSK